MHVDLLQTLRCPGDHASSWLVASASRSEGRHIIEGVLGCPVCSAEYVIRDGAAWFGQHDNAAHVAGGISGDEDEITRIAAFLAFDERGGTYLLEGPLCVFADALADVAPARFVLHGPPLNCHGHAVLRGAGDAVPVTAQSLRGAALSRASGALAQEAADALLPKGRLVAPAETPVPNGITVLARDERQWVGERDGTVSAPVELRRR